MGTNTITIIFTVSDYFVQKSKNNKEYVKIKTETGEILHDWMNLNENYLLYGRSRNELLALEAEVLYQDKFPPKIVSVKASPQANRDQRIEKFVSRKEDNIAWSVATNKGVDIVVALINNGKFENEGLNENPLLSLGDKIQNSLTKWINFLYELESQKKTPADENE